MKSPNWLQLSRASANGRERRTSHGSEVSGREERHPERVVTQRTVRIARRRETCCFFMQNGFVRLQNYNYFPYFPLFFSEKTYEIVATDRELRKKLYFCALKKSGKHKLASNNI